MKFSPKDLYTLQELFDRDFFLKPQEDNKNSQLIGMKTEEI